MSRKPRIALIHATPVAIEPIRLALASHWSEAEAFNLLDDSLSTDLATAGELTDDLQRRILDLALYAKRLGADGILYTCSAFGSAIEKAADLLDIPVLKPNEAMFETAVEAGGKIAMIVTFAPAQESMEQEFKVEAERFGSTALLRSVLIEPAMAALKAGDEATHNRLIAECAEQLEGYSAIILAHFSTAVAAAEVRHRTNIPILTSPDTAVAKLKRLVAHPLGSSPLEPRVT